LKSACHYQSDTEIPCDNPCGVMGSCRPLENPAMLTIRFAALSDVLLLKTMIDEFAEFEHLSVSITEETLARDGFGPEPRFRVLLAESDGQAAGYALFFDYYSSFEGRMLFWKMFSFARSFEGKTLAELYSRASPQLPCKMIASA